MMKISEKDRYMRTKATMSGKVDTLKKMRAELEPLQAEVAHNQPPEIQWLKLRLDILISQGEDIIRQLDDEIEYQERLERMDKAKWNLKLLESAYCSSVSKSSTVN